MSSKSADFRPSLEASPELVSDKLVLVLKTQIDQITKDLALGQISELTVICLRYVLAFLEYTRFATPEEIPAINSCDITIEQTIISMQQILETMTEAETAPEESSLYDQFGIFLIKLRDVKVKGASVYDIVSDNPDPDLLNLLKQVFGEDLTAKLNLRERLRPKIKTLIQVDLPTKFQDPVPLTS